MDALTILALLFLAFAAGYLTHWISSRKLRRRLKEVEHTLEGINEQLLPVRRRRWF